MIPVVGYEVKRLLTENERLREIINEQPEKWSFDTLMWAADKILDEIFPADIFTGVSGDAGPRLVAALRDCRTIMKNANEH